MDDLYNYACYFSVSEKFAVPSFSLGVEFCDGSAKYQAKKIDGKDDWLKSIIIK